MTENNRDKLAAGTMLSALFNNFSVGALCGVALTGAFFLASSYPDDVGLDRTDEKAALVIQTVEGGFTYAAAVLLNRGADVNAREGLPLRIAAKAGNTDMVKLLLDHGADVHIRDEAALFWAAKSGHTDTVKLLLEHGADVSADNGAALLWARNGGHHDTVKVLEDHILKLLDAALPAKQETGAPAQNYPGL